MDYADIFLKRYPQTIDSALKNYEEGSALYNAAQRLKKGIEIKKRRPQENNGESMITVHAAAGALAPLAGYTDTTFRTLVSRWGCGLYFTEMISAKGVCYNHSMSLEIADKMIPVNGDRPVVAVQLFGSEPEFLARAGRIIEEKGLADILDINMGCPVKKVVKTMSGSALMKDPVLAAECVAALNEAVSIPVTVKIRAGWDDSSKNACQVAEKCVNAGAAAVAIHPRTRSQMFSGKPDWETAARVRQCLSPSIPLSANGDIHFLEDALEIMVQTGCDNVMIGRGCLGNPWLFFELQHLMPGGTVRDKLGLSGLGKLVYQHFLLSIDRFGIERGIKRLRKHAVWYAAGLRNAKKFRNDIIQADTLDAVEKALTNVFGSDFQDFDFSTM